VRALVATAACLLFAPAALAADGAWSPPATLSSDHAGEPQVAITPGGDALALWGTQFDGHGAIGYALRPTGGAFGESQSLGGSGAYAGPLAANASGAAAFVWSEGAEWAAAGYRPAGAALARVTAVPTWDPSDWALAAPTAVAPNGDAVFLLGHRVPATDGQPERVDRFAMVRYGQGAFGAPRELPGAPAPHVLGLTAGPDGRFTVVWYEPAGEGAVRLASSSGTPEEGFSAPQPVPGSETRFVVPLTAVANARGDIAVAWGTMDPNIPLPTVRVAVRPAGGSWSAPAKVSGRLGETEADLAIAGDGRVLAAWSDGIEAFTRLRGIDGRWGPTEAVPDTPACCDGPEAVALERSPSAAFDGRGNALMVWADQSDHARGVRAAVRPPNGPWAPFESVDDRSGYVLAPQLAVDAAGGAVVVWNLNDRQYGQQSGRSWVRASTFDPVAPAITAFRRTRRGFAYRASKPARVALSVARGRMAVQTVRRARFARSARLRVRLSPGRYRATLTARSRAGHGATPRTIGFRVR
jgi:hypothetical protein